MYILENKLPVYTGGFLFEKIKEVDGTRIYYLLAREVLKKILPK